MTTLVGGVDATGRDLPMPWIFGAVQETGWVFRIPGIQHLPPVAVEAAVLALLVFAVWRWGFGHLSRACERQADLHGAHLVGDPAVMASALRAVALRSGQPENAPSWRHHPIAARIAFLERSAVDPAVVVDHHRLVATLRLQVILLVFLASLLAISALATPGTLPEPQAAIRAMVERDPALGEALAGTQRGDTGPLIRWLNRADGRDRQALAVFTLAECGALEAAHPPGFTTSDQDLYRLRYRLIALAALSTERTDLDLAIENALAYGLVAGTATPTADGLARAVAILPRLEAAVAKLPDHGLIDTIACVRFRQGEFETARHLWSTALARLAETGQGGDPERRAVAERLYRLRLEAAAANREISAGRRDGPPRPLPLEFGPVPATPTGPIP
jgi:hypothetical protein